MTTEMNDVWKLETGLRASIERFTTVSAYFAQTANYQTGIPYRIVILGYDEETETCTVKMTVGTDWVSTDGGKTIQHPTKNRINMNSTYGRWIGASVGIPELATELQNRTAPIARGNGPLVAEIWVNLILKLEAVEYQFGKPSKDNPPRNYLMPVEFLGVAQLTGNQPSGTVTPSAPQVQSAQSPAMPAAMSPAERIAAARGNTAPSSASPLVSQLHELARANATFEAFVAAAFAIPEVLADDELAVLVATPNGVYADARK